MSSHYLKLYVQFSSSHNANSRIYLLLCTQKPDGRQTGESREKISGENDREKQLQLGIFSPYFREIY